MSNSFSTQRANYCTWPSLAARVPEDDVSGALGREGLSGVEAKAMCAGRAVGVSDGRLRCSHRGYQSSMLGRARWTASRGQRKSSRRVPSDCYTTSAAPFGGSSTPGPARTWLSRGLYVDPIVHHLQGMLSGMLAASLLALRFVCGDVVLFCRWFPLFNSIGNARSPHIHCSRCLSHFLLSDAHFRRQIGSSVCLRDAIPQLK